MMYSTCQLLNEALGKATEVLGELLIRYHWGVLGINHSVIDQNNLSGCRAKDIYFCVQSTGADE